MTTEKRAELVKWLIERHGDERAANYLTADAGESVAYKLATAMLDKWPTIAELNALAAIVGENTANAALEQTFIGRDAERAK